MRILELIDTGTFDILLNIWDITVEKTESESEFIKIMVWGMFCGLHNQAMEHNILGKNKVALAELDIDYVKYKFEESLFDPEYKYYKEIQPEYNPE